MGSSPADARIMDSLSRLLEVERETTERLREERDKLRSVLVVLTAWGRCDIPNTMGAMAEIIMEADAALRATAKEKDNG